MNFDVCEPLRIQTQAKADECTSCALAAIAEDILKAPVDPDYIYGNSAVGGSFGITPDDAMTAVIEKGVKKIGATEPSYPFTSFRHSLPWIFRFSSIVSMLQIYRRSFFCGIYWQPDWDTAPGGIMTMPNQWLTWFPHAVKIYGVVNINGKIYLKVQNSLGDAKGDKGIWYMPKEIANRLNFAYQPL